MREELFDVEYHNSNLERIAREINPTIEVKKNSCGFMLATIEIQERKSPNNSKL